MSEVGSSAEWGYWLGKRNSNILYMCTLCAYHIYHMIMRGNVIALYSEQGYLINNCSKTHENSTYAIDTNLPLYIISVRFCPALSRFVLLVYHSFESTQGKSTKQADLSLVIKITDVDVHWPGDGWCLGGEGEGEGE